MPLMPLMPLTAMVDWVSDERGRIEMEGRRRVLREGGRFGGR